MRKIFFVLFAFLFCCALPAGAGETDHVQLLIGMSSTAFKYHEELASPQKSNESASIKPLVYDVRLFPTGGASHIELKYWSISNVSSQYDGADLNTGAPVSATDTLGFENYEGTLTMALTEEVQAYAGYGHRKWDRFLAGNPGYREIYSWDYAPVGVKLMYGDRTKAQIGIDASTRATSRGIIKVITSRTYAGGADSQMNLGSRVGYRISIPMNYRSGPLVLESSPFFEHSAIGRSNVVSNSTLAPTPGTGIVEPNSHTDQFGLEVLVGYGF